MQPEYLESKEEFNMASTTAKNALAGKANNQVSAKAKPKKAMQQLLVAMDREIKAALPSMMTSERFQRVALTAFSKNPALQKCEPASFLAAMMESAQLGLEPNTALGQAYLIPYGNKVQFQIGYKGLLELAQRSGKFKTLYSHTVYENDEFEVEYGLEATLKHKPIFSDRGKPIGYYAVYHLTNEGYSFVFMTHNEIMDHAQKFSKTFRSGTWQTDFEAMAKKTVIKQLLKYAPISIEVQRVMSADETVKTKIDSDMSMVDDETEFIEMEAEVTEVDGEQEMPGQVKMG